jgi:hypothetical protein
MRILLLALVITNYSIPANSQSKLKQDIGINLAGVLIKNQETVAPALIYKYSINDYQIRIQLALDGKLDSRDRKGNINSGGSFGSFSQDTILNFDPGRNVRYGFMLGVQKNTEIDQTNFSYYYGLDIIYMMTDFAQSGKGLVLQGNGGFDTTKNRINIRVSNKNKLNTYGIGLPVGITYKFGKCFYTSLEAKFVIAYQKGKSYNITETTQVQNFQEFTTKTETGDNLKGFDFGIKPLTGLCLGMFF